MVVLGVGGDRAEVISGRAWIGDGPKVSWWRGMVLKGGGRVRGSLVAVWMVILSSSELVPVLVGYLSVIEMVGVDGSGGGNGSIYTRPY